MNRLIPALVILLLVSTPCLAQQSLVGTYKLVGVQRTFDGKPEASPTRAPHGYLVLTPTIFLEFFTDGDRKAGASEKAKAALWGSLTAYAGSYRLEGDKIIVLVNTSWNEVYNGTQQTRDWQLQGNRLTLSSGPRPWGRDPSKKVVVRLEWEKIE